MSIRFTKQFAIENHRDIFEQLFFFLPEASFRYCRCLRLSVCPSVRVCGNHVLVRAITHHPFKLGSPNLDKRCKRPWLRALLFCGTIDCDVQGHIEPQSQHLPHFEHVHAITHHHQLKLQFPNLEQKCIIFQIPTNFGLDWNWSSIQFLISNQYQIELFMHNIAIL